MGHKMAKVDSALPPLKLVFKEEVEGETVFISEPRTVAKMHTEPWATTWDAENALFDIGVAIFFQNLRKENLDNAKIAAEEMDTSAANMRATYNLFSKSTAIGSDKVGLKRLANLPDKALIALGLIFKQAVATLTLPVQELFNVLCLLGKK